MSRTDAHRPYWVVQNSDGTVIDHDHDHFGKPIYGQQRRKRDKQGRYITKIQDKTVSARTILSYARDQDEQNLYPNKYTLAQINQARKVYDDGWGFAQVVIGQELGYVYEQTLIGYVPDECTIGQNEKHGRPYWSPDYTCTPALSDQQAATYNWGRYRSSRYYRNQDSRTRRRYARDELVTATKLYNNGDEMDDYDFGVHIGIDRWIWD
jgi:hypothetical protein